MVGSFEHGDELLRFIENEDLPDQLSEYNAVKKRLLQNRLN
jgi:hypothetical protein